MRGHPNAEGFKIALAHFDTRPLNIFETGTSAHGSDSKRLWDLYTSKFGGTTTSVDLREEPKNKLYGFVGKHTLLLVGDSLEVIKKLKFRQVDLVYLDSWDVDWENQLPAAEHGLKEFNLIRHQLPTGAVVIIDDTPASFEILSNHCDPEIFSKIPKNKNLLGKGGLILHNIKHGEDFEIL